MFPVCCCKWYQASKVQLFKSLGPTAWKKIETYDSRSWSSKGKFSDKGNPFSESGFLVEEGSLVKDVCVVKEFTLSTKLV